MNDDQKTRTQLISELAELRRTAIALQFVESERQRMSAELHEQKWLLNNVEQMGHIGHWRWDLAANSLSWSDELFRIFGVTHDFELTCHNIEAMIHPDDRADNQRQVNAILSGVDTVSIEFRIFRPDHTIRWIQQTTETSRDTSGSITSVFGIMQDITDRKHAEEALRESQTRLSMIYNSINEYIIFLKVLGERDYRIESCNEPFIKANQRAGIQIDAQVLSGMRAEYFLRDIIQAEPSKIDFIFRKYHETIVAGHKTEYEEKTSFPNGEVIVSETTLIPIMSDQGLCTHLLYVTRDITDRKLAEETLRENEARLQQVLEILPVGVWIADKHGTIIHGNPAGQQIWAGMRYVDPTQFGEYKAWWTATDKPVAPDEWGVSRAIMRGESSFEEELEIECFDGTHKYILNWAVPIWGEDHCIEGAVAVNQDITTRKQAEDALRESEEKFKLLFNNAADAHVLYQGDQFIDCNQTTLDMLGFHEKPQLLGLHPNRIFPKFQPDGQDSLEKAEAMIARAFAQGSHRFEWLCQRVDGSGLLLDVLLNVIRMKGKTLIHGVWQDITARKQAEELLQQHTRLLEEAVQQKQREMEAMFEKLMRQEKLATIGQMAGSIAHELRNPLGAIRQSIYYLKRLAHQQELAMSNPKVLRHLDLIDAELETSAQVITDLLDMTRAKPPQIKPTNLRPLLDDAVIHCHLPPQVRITMSLEPEPFWIAADSAQLKQVLLNVLTNAAQAIKGEGTITISASQSAESMESVITIHDTGTGIAPEALEKVFEPLYTTKASGTGLGLSICKQLIEAHRGTIAMTSRVGEGTSVTITLPRL